MKYDRWLANWFYQWDKAHPPKIGDGVSWCYLVLCKPWLKGT